MYRYLLISVLISYAVLATASDTDKELYNSGWRLNIDNDLLTGQSTDRDYTGGIALTLSGARAQQHPISIDSWRAGLDKIFRFSTLYNASENLSFHAQQYGMTLFTPSDIDSAEPVYDDRPYGSLFYMSNTEFNVDVSSDVAYVSTLTIGLLGLNIAEDVQKSLHAVTDSDVPNGWAHQISSGGEPTAMLSYGIQHHLLSSSTQQLKIETEANIGFITDVNAGFSWRWGNISSPWWTFNPYQSKYIQQSMPVFLNNNEGRQNQLYMWAGARLNLRIYNALLQGQFRHSEVTISSDELQHLVAEYWLGVTADFAKTYSASIFLRGHSDEFKGQNARGAAWIGLVLSRAY